MLKRAVLMCAVLLTFVVAGAKAQNAEVRVAHLSPDAPNVDVWVDGSRALENVPFKAVSGYLTLAAGLHRVQVTPAGASTPVVIDANLTLDAGKAYTVAATGLLAASDLKPIVLEDDRALDKKKAKVRFVHTSPDAPAVDIAIAGGAVLFSNVSFRQAGNYLSVAESAYDLEVRVAGTATVALALPGVALKAGTNYTVFAVGQLSNNSLGALPVVDQGTSKLRAAHLSPDAPNVDVWVNGTRTLENVPFKAISQYLEVPIGSYRLQVTPAGQSTPVVIDATLTFEANTAYTVAATGLLGANDLKPLVLVDEPNLEPSSARVRFVHTSPDAPAVDIAVAGGPILFSNIAFRQASGYLSVPEGSYSLEVRVAGTTTVALTIPDVMLFKGTNYTAFATGQLSNNSLGALLSVEQGKAKVRVAHLSPDAPNVDVWVDGERVLDNVPFKVVSEYLELSSGGHRVQVTPAGAATPVVIDAQLNLNANIAYTVAATGLLAANDLKPIVLEDDLEFSPNSAKVRFVHTSPDAPAVDIAVAGGPVLFANVKFREAGNYLSVAPGAYNLEVRAAGTSTVALAVPGVVLDGNANYVIFAAGELSKGTLAALPVVSRQTSTTVGEEVALPSAFELSQNYPNPFNPETKIQFNLRATQRVRLTIFDMLGREVVRLVDGLRPEGSYSVAWNGRDLTGQPVTSGAYFYTLETENFKQTKRMLLVR